MGNEKGNPRFGIIDTVTKINTQNMMNTGEGVVYLSPQNGIQGKRPLLGWRRRINLLRSGQ